MNEKQLKKTPQIPQVVCVGNALVDYLLTESENYLKRIEGLKGSMTLVAHEFITEALQKTQNTPVVVPGGSACNTAVGIGRLGGVGTRYVGKCGQDQEGSFYEQDLLKQGVTPKLRKSTDATGRCLSVVTPDAQRTMFTFLGAAAELQPQEITSDCFLGADIVHVEGYLVFNQKLIEVVLQTAKGAGARVSLDLASFNVVEADRPFLIDLVRNYVDILIANEDEALAYTQCRDETLALEKLAADAQMAVLKVGDRGSCIKTATDTVTVSPKTGGPVIDTTGAGDLWAAGFLYGLARNLPLGVSGTIGSLLGAEVCSVVGASIPESQWPQIVKEIETL